MDTFFSEQRTLAKYLATHPTTKTYIMRLERIAKAAQALLKSQRSIAPRENTPEEEALFDALDSVNFMFEESHFVQHETLEAEAHEAETGTFTG